MCADPPRGVLEAPPADRAEVPPHPLAPFHPAVGEWFTATFDECTPAQVRGFRAIAAGRSTLLLAPTGSGKTLAAFLVALETHPSGVRSTPDWSSGLLRVATVDGVDACRSPLAAHLLAAGFVPSGRALLLRRNAAANTGIDYATGTHG